MRRGWGRAAVTKPRAIKMKTKARATGGKGVCRMQQPFTMPELQLKEFSSVLVD